MTEIPPELFCDFLQSIQDRFRPENYSIIDNNCQNYHLFAFSHCTGNNFSDTVAQFLVGKPIPSWITGLPESVRLIIMTATN